MEMNNLIKKSYNFLFDCYFLSANKQTENYTFLNYFIQLHHNMSSPQYGHTIVTPADSPGRSSDMDDETISPTPPSMTLKQLNQKLNEQQSKIAAHDALISKLKDETNDSDRRILDLERREVMGYISVLIVLT